MKNKTFYKTILLLIFVFIFSCKNKTNTRVISNGLKQSLSFNKVKNQDDGLSDFTFQIDTTDVIKNLKFYKNIEFYKLNLTNYDSIFIGKRNDTIFTYDSGLNFVEVFLILNKKNHHNLGRLGNDFSVELLKSNDSTFHFSLSKLKDRNDDCVIFIAGDYPKKTISSITTDINGKIIDIKINDNSSVK
ncbi:hypothetical protein C7447_102662 [Tenacibaculum adriaticum]|uniref:Lipoprotein n=1 Tax=Tenacibaculum adriaticum TaxID=413713 RepID=A0A5S5DTR5_9FLAO|nr:hypothetical protein [Tenacibaculum adriaticum]TYP99340.1 hypothetical protein C7447_102662 [Tenacibaculum adriaticum]